EGGLAQVGLATAENRTTLEAWATARDLRVGQLSGPSSNDGLFSRLEPKIREKLARKRQIPPDEAGLLVLDDDVGLGSIEPTELLTSDLVRGMSSSPNLVGVLARITWLEYAPEGRGPMIANEDDAVHVVRQWAGCIFERLLLVKNVTSSPCHAALFD